MKRIILIVLALAALATPATASAQIPTEFWWGDSSNEHWVSPEKWDGIVRDEIAYARGGNDVLEGRGGLDDLHGGGGADLLKGGPESDWVEGGTGHDRLNGGLGPDIMYALDGKKDDINCGSNPFDIAIVDWHRVNGKRVPLDDVAADCERVE